MVHSLVCGVGFLFTRILCRILDIPVGGGLLSHSALSIMYFANLSALHCSRFCCTSCCSSLLHVVIRICKAEGWVVLVYICNVGLLDWIPTPSDVYTKWNKTDQFRFLCSKKSQLCSSYVQCEMMPTLYLEYLNDYLLSCLLSEGIIGQRRRCQALGYLVFYDLFQSFHVKSCVNAARNHTEVLLPPSTRQLSLYTNLFRINC